MRARIWILTLGWVFSSGVAFAEATQFVTEDAAVERILELADQRLAVMPAVAAVKWQTHGPIFDPPRENAVIQRAQDLGAPMGLVSDPVKRLFELQARLAREVQGALHEEWKAHGFSYSEPITTLVALRPRLDGLTVDLLQAIYLAAPVLQSDQFEAHYAALAQQRLHSAGWNDQNRHDLLDVLHSVRETPVPALQRITSSGLLRVGTTGDYAPFSLEANGSLSGSDIELAQKLAEQLHARAVFIHTSWSSMLDDLGRGAFDLSMGGVSVTPARQAQGAFSIPYSSGGKTILARCTDSGKFHGGLASVDRPKVRLIVNPGGTNEQYVRSNVHHAQINVYPDNRAIFDEITAGHADVMITDDVEAELQTHHHAGLCRTLPGTLTHADKAILMPRDPDFVKAVNEWLAPAIAAGEPARVLKSYLER
ncbi:MAG TPA: transporter substrate-binding domain-containing protein [Steroidobacteraceae bacterium]|nr:transporter substrate-binding domain-containing protein [Steroidobacteraceae bacterium]